MGRKASRALAVLVVCASLAAGLLAGERGRGGVRAPDGSAVGKQWLLVIGIDEYGDDSGWQKLHCAVSDAKAVRDALRSRYHIDQVFELYNQEATWGRIDERLRCLAKHTQQDDGVLIYYAGHGHLDKLTKLGAWVPADGDRTPRSWMASTYVKRLLGSMTAKHVLLISDSCFAGDFFKTRGDHVETIDEPYYRRKYRLQSRQAMTSGGEEPVMDSALDGHSPFAHYLLRTLARNQKPYLVPRELFDGLKLGVARNSGQTPEVGFLRDAGDEGGEFILFLKQHGTVPLEPKPDLTKLPPGPLPPPPPLAPRSTPWILYCTVGALALIALAVALINRKSYGSLFICCATPGAQVLLDGRPIGNANQQIDQVTSGPHTFTVRAQYSLDHKEEVVIMKDEVKRLNVQLTKAKGTLKVGSKPSGAEVELDDGSRDSTPAIFKDVEAGVHEVRFRKEGYVETASPVKVRPGGTSRLEVSLEPAPPVTSASDGRRDHGEADGDAALVASDAGQRKDPMSRPDFRGQTTGPCPSCGYPSLVARQSRLTGELYFGCENYPACKFNGCRSH